MDDLLADARICPEETIYQIGKEGDCPPPEVLLEIMQEGQTCGTLREHEAVIYGKKLLTNNTFISDREFYSEKYISVFDKPEDIDIDFATDLDGQVVYKGREGISPAKFVEYTRNLLQED